MNILMKKLIVIALVLTTIAATSCNRGVGCPTNFSANGKSVNK